MLKIFSLVSLLETALVRESSQHEWVERDHRLSLDTFYLRELDSDAKEFTFDVKKIIIRWQVKENKGFPLEQSIL